MRFSTNPFFTLSTKQFLPKNLKSQIYFSNFDFFSLQKVLTRLDQSESSGHLKAYYQA